MLEIRNASAGYGDAEVLHGISLYVGKGEIVTLVGANGAGKTTTLRLVSGTVRITEGVVFLNEVDVTHLPPEHIVARGIAHVPEGRRVFPRLSVEDNLKVGAYLIKDSATIRAQLQKVYALFPRLAERRRQYGETLSGGEQQMLALGRALMSHPKVLLLDEPSLGLAPLVVRSVAEAIAALRDEGMTILLVEQNARVAFDLSDRAYVIESGRIVLEGETAHLKNSPEVVASYLGGKVDAASSTSGGQI